MPNINLPQICKSTHLMSDSDIAGRVNPTGAIDLTESLGVISMPLSDSRRALLDEGGAGAFVK